MPKITFYFKIYSTLLIQPCAKHDGKGNPLPSYTSKIQRKIFLLTQLKKNV